MIMSYPKSYLKLGRPTVPTAAHFHLDIWLTSLVSI